MPDKLCRRQDMPPPGGYKPVRYKRVPASTMFSGPTIILGYVAITTVSIYLYNLNYKKIKKHEIELRSNKMAIYPMLLAERDRAYLKQLRKNRDAEEELMKDVPGWEVGTYFGEKVYKLLPKDTLVEPIFHEYYAHTKPGDWFRRAYISFYC